VNTVERDLLIVGAGPVGLYAAYYAGFRGLTTVVADSLPELGGQVTAMYPEKPIYDVAGFPAIRGRDLVAGLAEQADHFAPTYLLGERALTLVRDEAGVITVTTHRDTEIRCRAVVISGGIGTFTPRPLPVGEAWLGRGLAYFVPALDEHAGRDVVVVGGGDSACDWALSLEPIARSVTLVHRRAAFRAHAHSVARLHASTVEVITDAEVTGIGGGRTRRARRGHRPRRHLPPPGAGRDRSARIHREPRADPAVGPRGRREPLPAGGHDDVHRTSRACSPPGTSPTTAARCG
jgi:thioredoxin reductase